MSGEDLFDRVLYSAALLGVATAFFQFNKKAWVGACRLSDYVLFEDVERIRIKKEEEEKEKYARLREEEKEEYARLREKFEKEKGED